MLLHYPATLLMQCQASRLIDVKADMQATPAKGKAAKAAAEAEDQDTVAAMQKVAAAIAKLPEEPGKFSLMEKQEGGGYQQGGDSVPPPQHGSKVQPCCL